MASARARYEGETSTKTGAIIAAFAMSIALPLAAQQMFFYPSQGQSPEQQSKDQGECQAWAVQQTGFDPANPTTPTATAPAPAPQGRAQGRGGPPAACVTGPSAGSVRAERCRQYEAQLTQQRDGYNRALAACMQGRGYSVS